jgi:hypothetical protein
MRYLYLACLGLLAHTARGQAADSLAVDAVAADSASYPVAPDERWVRSQTDSTGECTEVLHWEGRGGLVRVYHATGQLKQYIPYADLLAGRLHGVSTTWYADGQLAVFQVFVRGQRDGELRVYYPSGRLKRQTQYSDGNELPGSCFDLEGARLPYFPYEQPPLYPGGPLQLTNEINKSLRRVRLVGPVRLSKAQIHVNFQVSESGGIINPQVTLSEEKFTILPNGMNNFAVWQTTQEQTIAQLKNQIQQALTQLTKTFYPGQRDGATVNWQYSLTIPFDMEGPIPRWGTIRHPGTSFE